jgi:Protein of unknown function (DUF2958)
MQVLLTNELRTLFTSSFPLGSQEAKGDAAKVVAKFFFPMGRYTFFATEGSPQGDDFLFFGYCLSAISPDFDEWGYTSLSELQDLIVHDLRIERDAFLTPAARSVGELLNRQAA